MTKGKIPDYRVEQLALGELDEPTSAALRESMARAGDDRLAAIERSNQDILHRLPPAAVAAEVERRRTLQRGRRPTWLWVGAPATALAVAALIFVVWPPSTVEMDPAGRWASVPEVDTVRIKGLSSALVVYQKTDGGIARRLKQGERVREGDLIQLSYVAAGASHGVILSIDGRGVVTLHHPTEPYGSTRLAGRGETPLSHSYALDDAPRFERFLFVTSQVPLETEALVAAARTLAGSEDAERGRLPIDSRLTQTSFLLRKDP